MADIRKLYIELINDFDPYGDNNFNISDSNMLYNLIEIKDCMEKNGDLRDKSIVNDINRLNTLIEIFESLGIKPEY